MRTTLRNITSKLFEIKNFLNLTFSEIKFFQKITWFYYNFQIFTCWIDCYSICLIIISSFYCSLKKHLNNITALYIANTQLSTRRITITYSDNWKFRVKTSRFCYYCLIVDYNLSNWTIRWKSNCIFKNTSDISFLFIQKYSNWLFTPPS